MVEALNLFALEKLAKEQMPEAAWGYYASGAWDEVKLRCIIERRFWTLQ